MRPEVFHRSRELSLAAHTRSTAEIPVLAEAWALLKAGGAGRIACTSARARPRSPYGGYMRRGNRLSYRTATSRSRRLAATLVPCAFGVASIAACSGGGDVSSDQLDQHATLAPKNVTKL